MTFLCGQGCLAQCCVRECRLARCDRGLVVVASSVSLVLVAVRVTALSGSLLGSSSLSILHSQDNVSHHGWSIYTLIATIVTWKVLFDKVFFFRMLKLLWPVVLLSLCLSLTAGFTVLRGEVGLSGHLPQEASHSPPQEFSALLYSLLQDTEAAQPAEGLHLLP